MLNIPALLRDILVAILGNSNLTARILQVIGLPAQEDSLQLVITAVDQTVLDIEDSTFGLAAIEASITSLTGDVAAVNSLVTSALSILDTWVAGGVPLPVTPPTGYGGDAGATAAAVWGDTAAYTTPQKGWFVNNAGAVAALKTIGFGTIYAQAPLFSVVWDAATSIFPNPTVTPSPLLANVLPIDTVMSFLTREAPLFAWSTWPYDSDYTFAEDPSTTLPAWIFRYSEPEFQALKLGMFPVSAVAGPPVWPGIANVALGSPTAISSQFTIDGPMDGVIVLITDVTISKIELAYDTATAIRNIGGLSFVNDNGDQEAFQLLSFTDQSYTPFTMRRAAGVRFRADPSVVGTVTPWTIV